MLKQMRSEKEMLDLIINTAKTDERVRAVIMNGSRANPAAPRDEFQDYDIVCIVTELDSFVRNHAWIDVFGPRLMLQMPETMRYPSGEGHFNYQMLFEDYNRIDLTLIPLAKLGIMGSDSQTIILLDKDGILHRPPPSDADYHIKPPTELFFLSCCNNFWWCMQNTAKGITRDELPYAMLMLHNVIRIELHDMISWHIGTKTDFSVSSGKMGKYFKRYLEPRLYDMYLKTYSGADYTNLWDSIFYMCELFRELAPGVGAKLGYPYSRGDEENMMEYLRWVSSH